MNVATSRRRIQKLNLRQWRLRGQGLVEYALIMVMVAIVILIILTFLGQVVFTNLYSKIGSNMQSVNGN